MDRLEPNACDLTVNLESVSVAPFYVDLLIYCVFCSLLNSM